MCIARLCGSLKVSKADSGECQKCSAPQTTSCVKIQDVAKNAPSRKLVMIDEWDDEEYYSQLAEHIYTENHGSEEWDALFEKSEFEFAELCDQLRSFKWKRYDFIVKKLVMRAFNGDSDSDAVSFTSSDYAEMYDHYDF